MKRLRLNCTMFIAWLILLYNVERLNGPINVAPFVYLVLVIVLPILLFPQAQRFRLPWALLLAVPIVVLPKLWMGQLSGDQWLAITITEVLALNVTIILAYQLSRVFEESREAVVWSNSSTAGFRRSVGGLSDGLSAATRRAASGTGTPVRSTYVASSRKRFR